MPLMCSRACIWRRVCICCCSTGNTGAAGSGSICRCVWCCGGPPCICVSITSWICWAAWWWHWPAGGWRRNTRQQPKINQCRPRKSKVNRLKLHPETAGFGQFFHFALIEQLAVFLGFQKMLAQFLLVAVQQEFQFLQAVRPAEAGEKFRPGK